MININLLPQEKRRKGNKSQPFKPVWASLVIVSIGMVGFTYLLRINEKEISTNQQNAVKKITSVKKQLADYDKIKSQLSSLKTNLQEIEKLSNNSEILPNVITKVKQNLPADVQLTGFSLVASGDSNITLNASAKSARAAARLKTKLDQENWVASSTINNITNTEDGITTFTVEIVLKEQK